MTSEGQALRTSKAFSFAAAKLAFGASLYLYLCHPQYIVEFSFCKCDKEVADLTISIGFSSQWNLGKNKHSWPAALIAISSIDGWSWKSSCCDRSWAMQHFWLSKGQTGKHLAFITSNPHSLRQSFRPFALPSDVIISCLIPGIEGPGSIEEWPCSSVSVVHHHLVCSL